MSTSTKFTELEIYHMSLEIENLNNEAEAMQYQMNLLNQEIKGLKARAELEEKRLDNMACIVLFLTSVSERREEWIAKV
jgi:hypothetical protein